MASLAFGQQVPKTTFDDLVNINTFFPPYTVMGLHALSKSRAYKIASVWCEAEVFLHGKLGSGVHPQVIDHAIKKIKPSLQHDNFFGFIDSCHFILWNMHCAGVFNCVPVFERYAEFRGDEQKLLEFEIGMAQMFGTGETIILLGRDEEIQRILACTTLDCDGAVMLHEMQRNSKLEVERECFTKKNMLNELLRRKAAQRMTESLSAPQKFLVRNPFNLHFYGSAHVRSQYIPNPYETPNNKIPPYFSRYKLTQGPFHAGTSIGNDSSNHGSPVSKSNSGGSTNKISDSLSHLTIPAGRRCIGRVGRLDLSNRDGLLPPPPKMGSLC